MRKKIMIKKDSLTVNITSHLFPLKYLSETVNLYFWIRQYPYKSQLFHVMLYTR